ncbi:MAG: NAD-dependent epimerase/dehydratase family protein [Nitrososphaerota archaeon]|nr:NAD-dependent epimerase/dehydratase family protein [Nitrososphaerota archaeon]
MRGLRGPNPGSILITGAAGFMGSYLVPRLLSDGYDVTALDLKGAFTKGTLRGVENKIRVVEVDITNYEELNRVDVHPDYIHHLAAIAAPGLCHAQPKLAYDVNVLGTHNVLRFAKSRDVKRFLLTSSAHVYGISPRYMPTPEIQPVWLQDDVYTATKIIDEYLVRLFYENYSLPYTTIRLFNSYGPRQTTDYFIPAKIDEALRTGKIVLRGKSVRKDFVYITDVIDAYVKMLESDFVGEINVGSGIPTSLGEVASYIAKSLKAELQFAEDDSPSSMQSDVSRARKAIGWEATVKLEDGLNTTIESIRKQKQDAERN